MKKLYFFLKRAFFDFTNPNRFQVSNNFLDKDSGFPYALDYTTKGMKDYYNLMFDENGIIMMSHYIDHESDETNYYSPVKIAHYALAAYNDYLKTGEEVNLELFRKHIRFLSDNYQFHQGNDKMLVWYTPSTNPKYHIEMNYISSIVQGLTISALARAYLLFNTNDYFEVAEKALNIFELPVEKGGILADSEWGPMYEEYPGVPYSHVVNGFIFSLIGLFDLYTLCNSEKAKMLFDQGIETLISVLPNWYLDHWSKYDLCDITDNRKINLATNHYQNLHADQLWILYRQTNNTIFKEYAERTEKQLQRKYSLFQVYINKFQNLILK